MHILGKLRPITIKLCQFMHLKVSGSKNKNVEYKDLLSLFYGISLKSILTKYCQIDNQKLKIIKPSNSIDFSQSCV